ncbi:MAG: [NiFe]-hydrogenase assembly chaperone HybE [Hyphomicrobiaceae bacterium]|nr:MAG: [NiFe]-hydrogenase assembly chaperone HybE [Hyphomicrobiaceae bacterium]
MAEDTTAATNAEDVAIRLEAAFAKVLAERMHDVPIVNKALHVEAAGVRAVEQGWLCALVTPWSINLMLLPRSPDDVAAWRALGAGATATHGFPAGRFGFITGEEAGLGAYQMCSLFSPVLEFDSHTAAVLTARAALEALFDAALAPGDGDKQGTSGEPSSIATAPARAKSQPGVTRRGLLLGLGDQTRTREQ